MNPPPAPELAGPIRLRLPPTAAERAFAGALVFEGTLGELAHALRTHRLAPAQVDLLFVVREVLVRFEAFASRDLDLATEALPAAATVIELKARLLLPRPPREADEDEDSARADALAAVAALEALEEAIVELRERRERRRHLLPARASAPSYPRRPRPLGVPLARLAELAARLRPGPYFEIVRDRLTVTAAIGRILASLRPGQRRRFDELLDDAEWSTRTVFFAGALELVRDGRCELHQGEAFGPLEVEGRSSPRPRSPS
ncbi:MAG: segregation and condensation protein A [Trueperaceae bacterium]